MTENMENDNRKDLQRKKGSFAGGVVVGMAAALLIFCGVYFGSRLVSVLEAKNGGGMITSAVPVNRHESFLDKEAAAKLRILENTIKDYFYLSEVTDEKLEEGMYRGIVASLEDPYSEYYSAEELVRIMEETEGVYYGIGAYVSMDAETKLPKISGVIENTPAEEAGLRSNDLIYEVEETSVYGLTLSEVVSLIKGEEGTKVKLTLIREGESDYVELLVERRKVEAPTVNFEMMEDGMAYIQIVEFADVTVDQFAEALAMAKGSSMKGLKVEAPTVNFEMMEDGMAYIQIVEFADVTVDQFAEALAMAKGSSMKGLILDLRANPGGSLDAVVEIARMLLPEGMIVYTEGKSGVHQEYTCDGTRRLQTPLTVLVDMNSASASEILAGAIKDHGIGTLVGTTTFGKGIVQQIIPYSDGSAVKLTISSYFTPNGNNIHGVGIAPDIECEFDGEAYYNTENPVDNQLEKAKEVLREKMR